jgi:ataxia telangiectasia mutated family protein
MVLSSEIRRAPYADILSMSLGSGLFNDHIEQLISGVIHKIAFSSPKQLFETYAASVTLKFIEDRRDISRLPPLILGYSNRRESCSAFLRLGLPLALLNSDVEEPELWRQFRHLTAIVGISEEDALQSIFPYRTALKLCSTFDDDDYASRVQSDTLWQAILTWSPSSSLDGLTIAGVVRHLDAILAHMLLVVGEIDAGPAGDLSLAIRSSMPAVADNLTILTKFQSNHEPLMHRPSAPLYGARAVLQAIAWLERHLKSALPVPETLYHVLQRLFRSITLTPLVNEKVRGINAVCILCALYAPVFENSPALLRNVMFGITPILAHPALYHRAQSIIHWACNVYARMAEPDSRFPEFLVRVANTASQLCREHEESKPPIGTELLEWVQAIGVLIQSVPNLAGQAKSAMLLWPKSISTPSTANGLTYRDVSRALSDDSFTSNKFRLVQRLRQLIQEKRGFRPPHGDFWSLKSCIPSDSELVDADLEAYLDVLAVQAGRVTVLKDSPVRRTLGQRHQSETRSSRKAAGSFMLVLPHHAIIGVLLDRMHLSTVAIRDVAYQSLRLLLSLQNNHLNTWKSPPEDITLLASRPIDILSAKQAQMGELNASAHYVESSNNFPQWIRTTTQFMCDVLGNLDPFYAQLQPVVDADEEFAAELFPVAVHELLRRQNGGISRGVLSDFFRRVLKHNATSVLALQTIVETCLHLRSFQHNPIDDSATGNNRWLDIEFPILSTAAAKCGAYTTALLFLELGRETATSTLDAYVSDQESILYDIYSHIEEPDGFYGIKSQDVARFLVRRFRHESEWDKAFRFDGAALEASPDQNTPKDAHSVGVVQALHASGLDHLAVSMLHNFRQEHSSSLSTEIELAWRTENWELPISELDTSAGASLFCALRSIHRQGEIIAMDTVVDDAVRREVGYLRDLGNESMAEVRSCLRRLLCLREVKDWSLRPVQETLASNDWSPSMANRWGRVPIDYQ